MGSGSLAVSETSLFRHLNAMDLLAQKDTFRLLHFYLFEL
jgi:hypothetical protein